MSHKGFIACIGTVALVALALTVLPAVSASAEDLPSPQNIINKYIKATGGEAAYKAIKNRTIIGNLLIVAMGMSGNMTNYVEPPNAKSIMEIEGFGEFLSGIKDGVVWSSSMMGGDQVLEGAEAKSALRQADMQEWLNWQNYYASAETVGEEAVGDAAAWKVAFTPEEGEAVTYWFDKDSGLILQSFGPGLGGPATTKYEDYREVGGVLVAHGIFMQGVNGPIEITYETIEVNTSIDASMFDVPETIVALMTASDEEGSDEKASSEEGSEEK